jgi:hypothetical protein
LSAAATAGTASTLLGDVAGPVSQRRKRERFEPGVRVTASPAAAIAADPLQQRNQYVR